MDIQAIKRAMLFLDAYFNDVLPENVVGDFRAWIAGKYQSEEKIEAMYQLWTKGTKLDKNADPDAMKSFEEVARKLNFPKAFEEEFLKMRNDIPLLQMREETLPYDTDEVSAAEPQRAAKRGTLSLAPGRRTLMRVAAAVALFAVLGGGTWLFLSRPQPVAPQIAMVTMAVPDTLGAQGRIELPDGSDIFIRPGSAISYAEDFGAGEKRRVVLDSGEVYLEVEKDSLRQFVVETGALKVSVLGTRFNVVASPGNAQTLVTLYEGKVEVAGITGTGGQTVVDIAPGQRLVYDNATGKYVIEQVTARVPDWVTARLTFLDSRYDEVIRAIEWYYGVKVETEGELNPQTVVTFRLRGTENLDQAMFMLHSVSNEFSYAIDGKKVKIKPTT